MMKVLIALLIIIALAIPVSATEITAPRVPPSGMDRMPADTDHFGEALWELIVRSLKRMEPELEEATNVTASMFVSALLVTLLPIFAEKTRPAVSIAGSTILATLMFRRTDSMIAYASEAVWEICEYGKLLCPVLTTALAAQGGITSSAALYAGTNAFIAVMSMLVSRWIVPMVYIFLAFSVANSALGEAILKKFADTVKFLLHWLLKTILIVFTTYMSITGAVSGTTDAAATKATKVVFSTVVPVVGNILSDASESVLVSIGVMKNAAGIYGILAVLAVFMGPFVKVGIQYLLLKVSAVLCSLFADKSITALIEDFSAAMGILLAMVAASCVLVLISTICFMKGMGS